MDEPLFGERKQSTKLLIWAAVGIVVGFAAFTAIVAVINGIRVNRFHFALAGAVLVSLGGLAILFKWWNAGDLDPKFNYLLMYFVFSFICVCVACQFYIWAKKPFVPPPITCGPDNFGLYIIATQVCFTNITAQCFPGSGTLNPGQGCAFLDTSTGIYSCQNCTGNPVNNRNAEYDANLKVRYVA